VPIVRVSTVCVSTISLVLAACGPTPEEQATTAAAQREAQQAADRRMAAAQQAATDRQNAAIKAQKDAADRDAWDRKTGQGIYSNSSPNGPAYSPPQQPSASSSSNPVDNVRNQIQNDMDKMENAGTLSP
jgi:sRNA-binding protein